MIEHMQIPPLMEYKKTAQFLLEELVQITGASRAIMANPERRRNNIIYKNPPLETQQAYSGNYPDIIITLPNISETINISHPNMQIPQSDVPGLVKHLERSLENAEKYEAAWRTNLLDDLTGLLNKKAIKMQFAEAIFEYERQGNCFGLAFMDLDNFKLINDTYGHLKGDAVLVELAEKLQNSFRKSDIIGRFGGDEFIILFQGISAEQEPVLQKRIAKVLAHIDAIQAPLSASVGFAYYGQDGCDFDSLVSSADARMYRLKHQVNKIRLKGGFERKEVAVLEPQAWYK